MGKFWSIKRLYGLALLAFTAEASAHHSWPVDSDHLVTVKGVVTDFKWENPHPMITLVVTTAEGKQETWQIGGPALGRMSAKGWTPTTVKAGDVITGMGYQFKNGEKIIRLEKVTLADGKSISVYGAD